LSEIQHANIVPLNYMSIWPLLSFRGLKRVVHSQHIYPTVFARLQ